MGGGGGGEIGGSGDLIVSRFLYCRSGQLILKVPGSPKYAAVAPPPTHTHSTPGPSNPSNPTHPSHFSFC